MRTFQKTVNKQIYLGQGRLYGNGVEENTTINLTVENDAAIKIDSQTEKQMISFNIFNGM